MNANKKHVILIASLLLFMLTGFCLKAGAEDQVIYAKGEYQAGESESPAVAKERALDQAMRNAAEQAGVYVESYSKTNNMTLTTDEVKIISSAMVKVVEKKFSVTLVDSKTGACLYQASITVKISSDDIAALRNKAQDKDAKKEFADIQQRFAEQQEEIDRLKKQLGSAQTDEEKKRAEAEIRQNENKFLAEKYYEAAERLYSSGNYNEALELYNQAIELVPSADYYISRAYCFASLGDKDKEMADFNAAVKADKTYYRSYYVRALAYEGFEKYDLALSDYSRAIAFSPDTPWLYVCRANLYWFNLNNEDKALDDYSQAIARNNDDNDASMAYYWRGQIYFARAEYEQAVTDFEFYQTHNPSDPYSFMWLARTYNLLDRKTDAVNTYRQLMDIDGIKQDESAKDLLDEAQNYIAANS